MDYSRDEALEAFIQASNLGSEPDLIQVEPPQIPAVITAIDRDLLHHLDLPTDLLQGPTTADRDDILGRNEAAQIFTFTSESAIVGSWKKTAKEEQQLNKVNGEIAKLKTILGELDPSTERRQYKTQAAASMVALATVVEKPATMVKKPASMGRPELQTLDQFCCTWATFVSQHGRMPKNRNVELVERRLYVQGAKWKARVTTGAYKGTKFTLLPTEVSKLKALSDWFGGGRAKASAIPVHSHTAKLATWYRKVAPTFEEWPGILDTYFIKRAPDDVRLWAACRLANISSHFGARACDPDSLQARSLAEDGINLDECDWEWTIAECGGRLAVVLLLRLSEEYRTSYWRWTSWLLARVVAV